MDPLSIGASALTICQTVVGVLQLIKAVQGAPDEIRALIDDLCDLEAVIKSVETASSQPASFHHAAQDGFPAIQRLVKKAKAKLLSLHDIVRHKLLPEPTSQSVPKFARLHWLQERHRVRALQDDLRDIKLNIVSVWGSITSFNLSQVLLQLKDVTLASEVIATNQEVIAQQQASSSRHQSRILTEIHHFLHHSHKDGQPEPHIKQIPLCSSPDSYSSGVELLRPLEPRKPTNVPVPEVDDMGWKSQTVVTEPLDWVSYAIQNDRKNSTDSLLPRYEEVALDRRVAVMSTTAHLTTPQLLNGILGSLFLGFSNYVIQTRAPGKRINRGRSRRAFNLKYHFPQWLLSHALSLSVTYGGTTGPELLLKIPKARPGNSEIFYFACTGNVEGMRALFRNGLASPDDIEFGSGLTALHKAVDWRQIDMIRLLLSEGADAYLEDFNEWSSADTLAQLSLQPHVKNCKTYRDILYGIDTDVFDTLQFSTIHKSVLDLADLDLGKLLLASATEVNQPDSGGQTPLFWAATRGDVTAVRYLLQYGADVNLVTKLNESILHWSVEPRHGECTRLLLEHGAAPTVPSIFGTTALHYAAWKAEDSLSHLEPLVHHGADINFRNLNGQAPLHYAVCNDSTDSVGFLIRKGACLETKDNEGITPLFEALRNDSPKVTQLFLDHGADTAAVTNDGDNILHVAAAKSTSRAIKMLEMAGLQDMDINGKNKAGKTPRDLLHERPDRSDATIAAFEELLRSIESEGNSASIHGKLDLLADSHISASTGFAADDADCFEDAFEYLHTEKGPGVLVTEIS